MVENILTKRNVTFKMKFTVKSIISAAIVLLAAGLPQLVHLIAGPTGGVTLLPMYLPVLIGGCILGAYWGLAIGIASPLFSFLITSAFGNAMPAAARLPFMVAELAVFALVSGLFSELISKKAWIAFPAVLAAAVAGRATFLLLVWLFNDATTLTVSLVWQQIVTGLVGIAIQVVVVPLIIMIVKYFSEKEKKND